MPKGCTLHLFLKHLANFPGNKLDSTKSEAMLLNPSDARKLNYVFRQPWLNLANYVQTTTPKIISFNNLHSGNCFL